MFESEKVRPQDSALYEAIADRPYYKDSAAWAADREADIYIVCLGKHGTETPVVYRMQFQSHLLTFLLPEPDLNHPVPRLYVMLPPALSDRRSAIAEAIRRAFREAPALSAYGSLPRDVDGHIFDFESFPYESQQQWI